eukprot:gene15-158_t
MGPVGLALVAFGAAAASATPQPHGSRMELLAKYYTTESLSGSKKQRPVTKVVQLLQDMSKQLEADQKADEEIYEKLACWSKRLA